MTNMKCKNIKNKGIQFNTASIPSDQTKGKSHEIDKTLIHINFRFI